MKYKSKIQYLLVALLLNSSTAFAAPKRYVVDDTGILSEKKLKTLNDRAQTISEKYQMQVAFFLADNLYTREMTLDDYATECFQSFIGFENDGFMLAWNSKALRWTMVASGKGKEILPKSAKANFYDAYCGGKTHVEGIMAYLDAVDEHLSKVEKGEINFSFWETVKRSDNSAVVIIGITLVTIIVTGFCFRFKVQSLKFKVSGSKFNFVEGFAVQVQSP